MNDPGFLVLIPVKKVRATEVVPETLYSSFFIKTFHDIEFGHYVVALPISTVLKRSNATVVHWFSMHRVALLLLRYLVLAWNIKQQNTVIMRTTWVAASKPRFMTPSQRTRPRRSDVKRCDDTYDWYNYTLIQLLLRNAILGILNHTSTCE